MSSEAEEEMRPIEYKEGRELELTHVCKECGGGLVTAWGGYIHNINHHIISCSKNSEHEGEVKKQWARMEAQPIEVQNVLKRKEYHANKRPK